MIKEIESRRSIRRYKDIPVKKELIEEILKAGMLAPSSKNRQPWHFIVTTGSAKEQVLKAMEAGLKLGTVYNGYELYINGVQVKGNQVTEKTDITEYLTVGENEIKVVVPSEMMNTLIKVRSEIYGERERNINGLTENPVLTIY